MWTDPAYPDTEELLRFVVGEQITSQAGNSDLPEVLRHSDENEQYADGPTVRSISLTFDSHMDRMWGINGYHMGNAMSRVLIKPALGTIQKLVVSSRGMSGMMSSVRGGQKMSLQGKGMMSSGIRQRLSNPRFIKGLTHLMGTMFQPQSKASGRESQKLHGKRANDDKLFLSNDSSPSFEDPYSAFPATNNSTWRAQIESFWVRVKSAVRKRQMMGSHSSNFEGMAGYGGPYHSDSSMGASMNENMHAGTYTGWKGMMGSFGRRVKQRVKPRQMMGAGSGMMSGGSGMGSGMKGARPEWTHVLHLHLVVSLTSRRRTGIEC